MKGSAGPETCFMVEMYIERGVDRYARTVEVITQVEKSEDMANVKIYSTPTCVYCKMAKSFFKEHNISYTEVDVAADVQEREEMIKKSGQLGVPVIDIDGELTVGFDQARLSELLGVKQELILYGTFRILRH